MGTLLGLVTLYYYIIHEGRTVAPWGVASTPVLGGVVMQAFFQTSLHLPSLLVQMYVVHTTAPGFQSHQTGLLIDLCLSYPSCFNEQHVVQPNWRRTKGPSAMWTKFANHSEKDKISLCNVHEISHPMWLKQPSLPPILEKDKSPPPYILKTKSLRIISLRIASARVLLVM